MPPGVAGRSVVSGTGRGSMNAMRTTSLAVAEWLTRLRSEQIRSCGIPITSSHAR